MMGGRRIDHLGFRPIRLRELFGLERVGLFLLEGPGHRFDQLFGHRQFGSAD
jgi:hypothetical protein